MPPLTRREFFASLKPAWLTRRTLIVLAIAIAGYFVISLTLEITRDYTLAGILQFLGLCALALLALTLLQLLAAYCERLVRTGPVLVATILQTLGTALGYALVGFVALSLYEKWEARRSLPDLLFTLGLLLFLIGSHTYRQIVQQRAAPTPPLTEPASK